MKFYAEYVADACASDPPRIRGLIDGQYVRRLIGYTGARRSKIFTMDLLGPLTYREITRNPLRVALEDSAYYRRFSFEPQSAVCPSCALVLLGDEFWPHYNKHHARRPWWPNEEHWPGFKLAGKWLPPYEQR